MRLRDFPAGLRAWIADDVGNMVAKLDRRGTRGELRFLTGGGRRYFLPFYATPQLETPRPRFTARMAPWRAPRTFVP